ncbi:MAG: fructose-6-phosphate aldolase [Bacteroidia bacterium]
MYLIKIKGKAKIPDYAQLRDDNFTLIAYFRTDRPERALEKCGLAEKTIQIMKVIAGMPFGKMIKIEI